MRRVLVFFIVGVILFGAYSAQNANAQNANIAQRIIGTWATQSGEIWVFYANGNLTIADGRAIDSGEFKFVVMDTQLAIADNTGAFYSTLNILMSSDGRTLVLLYGSRSGEGIWLTKR